MDIGIGAGVYVRVLMLADSAARLSEGAVCVHAAGQVD